MEHFNEKEVQKNGYRHTALGWIPEEWEVKEFGEIARLERGKYVPNSNEDRKCIELEHIEQTTGRVLGWVSSKAQKSTKNVFKKGQVLFGKLRPYLQKYWKAEYDGVCSSEVWVMSAKNGSCCNDYLFRLIQSHRFIQVTNVSSGSKMPRADWDYVISYPFALPSPRERKIICDILDSCDDTIVKINQLIQLRKLGKKALMQLLLTGKKRLPGFDGEWESYNYSDIIEEVKRPVQWDDNELYHLISVRRRSGGIFERESLYGHQIKVKDLRTANEGDFLFSKMQIVHGASALVTKESDGAKISGSYIAVVAKDASILDIEFFNWWSKMPMFYHQTYISSYGVHIEKMTFDFESFLSLGLKLPELKEQQAIAAVLNTAEEEIKLLQQKYDTLKQQKKALMQQLLTGKKRVKV